MKRLIAALIALICALAWAEAAPGDLPYTNTLTFRWDVPSASEGVLCFRLYWRTNVPVGMPLIAPTIGQTNDFRPVKNDPGWRHLLDVPGTNTFVTITNPLPLRMMFFALTASNMVGESDFSEVVWLPAAPTTERKLRLLQME